LKTFVKQTFEKPRAGPGGRLADLVFDRCSFVDPWVWTKDGVFMEVERIAFKSCKVRSRGLSKLACREISFETAKNNPLLRVTNSVFDRVTFEGDFGSWFFCWLPDHLTPHDLAFVQRFYKDVPFALDIRRARFKDLTIRGVPGQLILRDPATSILVRRDRLESDRSWVDANDLRTFPVLFRLFLKNEPHLESTVFATSELSKSYEEDRATFQVLRGRGLAE